MHMLYGPAGRWVCGSVGLYCVPAMWVCVTVVCMGLLVCTVCLWVCVCVGLCGSEWVCDLWVCVGLWVRLT